MADKIGIECKLYYSSELLGSFVGGGSGPSTLSWTVIGNTQEVTLNLEKQEADATVRANNGWETTRYFLKSGSIDGTLKWDTEDAAFTALKDAWLNGTDIALAAMDGDINTSGIQGLVANFQIGNFSRNEPMTEIVSVDFTASPHEYPDWYEVS